MAHSPEELEHISIGEQLAEEKKHPYAPRPKSHVILAWVAIAVVLLAFLGTCYWMVNYGRV